MLLVHIHHLKIYFNLTIIFYINFRFKFSSWFSQFSSLFTSFNERSLFKSIISIF